MRCSSRLAAREKGARLGGMSFSVPSVLVFISHRVLKPAHPSLLRRRARLLAAQAVLVFVASQGGPTNVKGSARLFSLAYRCRLGSLPAFLPLRRRASPSSIPGRPSPPRSPSRPMTGSVPNPTQPHRSRTAPAQIARIMLVAAARSSPFALVCRFAR